MKYECGMRSVLLLALVCASCGGTSPVPPIDPSALMSTLTELEAFGEKRVGTDPGATAAAYVHTRFVKAGLKEISLETFQFPRHVVDAATMGVTLDGAAQTIGFDVFEGSGPGVVDADLLYVGFATAAEIAKVDLHGKVALVDRATTYHRSTQYENVIEAGAVAMLYGSTASDNLRQIGSVRRSWESMGPIPALTIGQDDGTTLKAALSANRAVQVTMDVTVHSVPSQGENIVGKILGSDAGGEIVIGAHFDTWFAGSSDNGGGIAALLAIAERRAREAKPRYTLVFVAYDGEEVALYGGYDFLRKHAVIAKEPILTVINFETPSAKGAALSGLAHSNHAVLDDALVDSDLNHDYPLYTTMEVVPMLFGGIIPTDIQGIYRAGFPTASTAVDAPYYHTTADTPDKVDTQMLAATAMDFDHALDDLALSSPDRFADLDSKLWTAEVALAQAEPASDVTVTMTVKDAMGTLQPNAMVEADLLVDDFTSAGHVDTTTDENGHASIQFSAAQVTMSQGSRFVHVTAGATYPLYEGVLPIN